MSHLPQVVEPRPDVGGDARHTAVHQVVHKDVFFPAGKTEQHRAAEGYVGQMVRHGLSITLRHGHMGPQPLTAVVTVLALCKRCVVWLRAGGEAHVIMLHSHPFFKSKKCSFGKFREYCVGFPASPVKALFYTAFVSPAHQS